MAIPLVAHFSAVSACVHGFSVTGFVWLLGDHIYPSALFGAVKPAAQAYLGCIDKPGATPAQPLFIDASETNVQGARDAGLHARCFTDVDTLERDLRSFGVIGD